MLTDKEKDFRRTGIGGSDVAAIAGISRWKTPLDIYHIKIGEKEDNVKSHGAYWGEALEDAIRRAYCEQSCKTAVKPKESFRHPELSFMIAHVDGLIDDGKGILEIKTADKMMGKLWGEQGTDQIPEEYLLQCAHYGKAFEKEGIEYVDIAVLIGGNDFRMYKYTRDKALEENIVKLENSFWNNHILSKVPPAPKTISDILSLFPRGLGGDSKTATQDVINTINFLKETRASIKALEEKEELYKKQVCESIADAEVLVDHAGMRLATWKNQETARFDTTSFKKEYTDLSKEFCKTTETRVLRIA